MKKLAILFGGTALLAACQSAPPPAPPPPVDINNPLMAPGYMAQAGSADQFEIQSGQLALQASQNPAIRNFANMIVADHTRSTQNGGVGSTVGWPNSAAPRAVAGAAGDARSAPLSGERAQLRHGVPAGADQRPPAGASAASELCGTRRRAGATYGGGPDRSRGADAPATDPVPEHGRHRRRRRPPPSTRRSGERG